MRKNIIVVMYLVGIMGIAMYAFSRLGSSNAWGAPPNLLKRKLNADPPSQSAAIVVDSKNHKVGNVFFNGANPQENTLVLIQVSSTDLALMWGQDGFADESQNGIPVTLFYPTADCSGQGYIAVGGGGSPAITTVPVVQPSVGQQGPVIVGTTVYYAQPPLSNIVMNSAQAFLDPNGAGEGCSPGFGGQPLGTYMAGPVTSFDLSSLGFTPPFSILQ